MCERQVYTAPSSSRIRIARLPLRDEARAVRAVRSGTSGQGLGCIDMTPTNPRPNEGGRRPRKDHPRHRPGHHAPSTACPGLTIRVKAGRKTARVIARTRAGQRTLPATVADALRPPSTPTEPEGALEPDAVIIPFGLFDAHAEAQRWP